MRNLIAGMALAALVGSAGAVQTVEGVTFDFTRDNDLSHTRRSNLGVAIGNFNYFDDEIGVGYSQFDISSLDIGAKAIITFQFISSTGPYYFDSDGTRITSPPTGIYSVLAYAEDVYSTGRDNKSLSVGVPVGIGLISASQSQRGDIFSVDVTSIFNYAKQTDVPVGIDFSDPLGHYGAARRNESISFGSFVLTVTPAVPEPSTYGLMALGLAAIAIVRTAGIGRPSARPRAGHPA